MGLVRSSEYADAVGGIVVAALLAVLLVAVLLREGRNSTLEQILAQSDYGSPVGFMGTLAVEECNPPVVRHGTAGDF